MVKIIFDKSEIIKTPPFKLEEIKKLVENETLIVKLKDNKNLFYVTFKSPFVFKETEKELIIKDKKLPIGISIFEDSVQVYPI